MCEQERERPTQSREKSGPSPQARVRPLKHAVSSTHETNKRNARRGQTPNVRKHSHTHDTSRGHAPAVSQAPQGQAHHVHGTQARGRRPQMRNGSGSSKDPGSPTVRSTVIQQLNAQLILANFVQEHTTPCAWCCKRGCISSPQKRPS